MALATYEKDPSDVLDYQIDWTDEMNDVSDTISSSSWTVSGATRDSQSNTTLLAKVWISGGSAGSTATATNTIVTAGGRTYERSITLVIKNL